MSIFDEMAVIGLPDGEVGDFRVDRFTIEEQARTWADWYEENL